MKYCQNCGTPVTGKFCTNCGAQVDAPITETVEDSAKVLDALYTLRAGLSQMSIKHDMTKPHQQNIDNKNNQESEIKSNIYKLKKQKEELAPQVRGKMDVQQYIALTKEKRNEIEQKKKKEKTFYILGNRVLFYSIFPFAILAVLTFFFPAIFPRISDFISLPTMTWESGFGGAVSGVFLVIPISFIVLAIASFIASIVMTKLSKKYKRSIENLENEYEKIVDNQLRRQNANQELAKCQNALVAANNAIEQLPSLEADNNSIKLYSQECVEIYNALYEGYAEVINPTDWQHVDYLIYAFETHRATSLKEALQQLDLMKRHNELRGIMLDIGNKICRTIELCATQLSYRLDSLAESQAMTNAGISQLNEGLLSASQMQSALLEKANVSSEQLANDVRQMKYYADLMAIKNNLLI